MDPTAFAVLMPMIGAAISALFWALVKDKDKQIAEKDERIDALEADLKTATNVLGKNTDALETVGETLQTVAHLMAQQMTTTSPASPAAPPPPAGASPKAPTTS